MKHLKTFEAFVNEDLVKKAADAEETKEIASDEGSDKDKKDEKEPETPEGEKKAEDTAADVQASAEDKAEGEGGEDKEVEKDRLEIEIQEGTTAKIALNATASSSVDMTVYVEDI